MKNKQGFTLVELLAVIIILGIIMVVVIPSTVNIIETSRKKSLENSAHGIIKAIEIAQVEYALSKGIEELKFYYTNGIESSNVSGIKLDYRGKKPRNGQVIIENNGEIAIAIHDGTYCAKKNFKDSLVQVSKAEVDGCAVATNTFAINFFGDDEDFFNAIATVSDGYIAVGSSSSTNSDLIGLNKGSDDAIIIKYDITGKIVWKHNYGGSCSENFYGITVVNDGYVAVGDSCSVDGDLIGLNKGDIDAIIVKYDLNGNVVWKKNYGGSDYDGFSSITAVNGGYVVVGLSSSTNDDLNGLNKGDGDAIIVKYDLTGNVVWKKNYGGSYYDSFSSITAVNDGYVAVGYSSSTNDDLNGLNKGDGDAIIVKYDLTGNVVWKKNYGGSDHDGFSSITAGNDGYVVVGLSSSTNGDLSGLNKGDSDAIIVKYDLTGNVVWKKNYGGSYYDIFSSITAVNDGYVAVGYSSSTNDDLNGLNKGDGDAIIVKYDLTGNVVWKKNYGGSDHDGFSSITAGNDGYVVVGENGSSDFFGDYIKCGLWWVKNNPTILKLDNNGEIELPSIGKNIGNDFYCGSEN